LIDEADTKIREQARQQAAKVQAWRESQWPAWAKEDLWTEADFAAICCGLVPSEVRGDPLARLVNQAREAISRGVLATKLAFVPRSDADTGARLYGTARHFVPATATEWAVTRFDAFPSRLLAAVKEQAQASPEPAAPAANRWPWGPHETKLLQMLAAAAEQFWKLYDPEDISTAPTNNRVEAWLKEKGVSARNAQVMATILRADNLPTGPRK